MLAWLCPQCGWDNLPWKQECRNLDCRRARVGNEDRDHLPAYALTQVRNEIATRKADLRKVVPMPIP